MSSAATRAKQPIAGVSPHQERTLEQVCPSIAATGIGQTLGALFDSIGLKINGIKLSYLIFCLPLAPVAAAVYLLQKISGQQYVLTNRSVEVRQLIGQKLLQKRPLHDIDSIRVAVLPGQAFFRAGDLELISARGEVLLRLAGVPWPERFRTAILETREARRQADQALALIEARQG